MILRWNKNDSLVVIGVDYEEELFEVVYQDENEYNDNDIRYLRMGGMVLWEGTPPTCSKCIKNKLTSCSKECYDFKAIRASRMQRVQKKHESLKDSKQVLFDSEKKNIKDMRRQGIIYTSWIYKSLFESEDNNERMDFNLSMIKNK